MSYHLSGIGTMLMSHFRKAILCFARLQKYCPSHLTQCYLEGRFICLNNSEHLLYEKDCLQVPLRAICSSELHNVTKLSKPQLQKTQDIESLLSEIRLSAHSKLGVQASSAIISNIHLLYKLGMTNDNIEICEHKQDGFIRSVYMNSHVKFLRSVNLDDADICNIMQRVPKFFMSAPYISKNIVEYMINVGVSMKNLRNLLIFSPSLFYRVKGRPQQIGTLLQGIMKEHQPEVDGTPILARMIRNDIKLFNRTEKEVKRNLRFLIELGIEGPNLVKIMHYCPSVLRIGTDFLQIRWNYLQKKLKLSDQEMIDCVIKHPRILTLADDKMKDKFNFLYNKAGFQPADVAKNPRLFERSLLHLEERHRILKEVKYTGNFIPLLTVWTKTFDDRIHKIKSQSEHIVTQKLTA